MTDEFMTVAEVAELLRLNQQTVRNWIESGFLPAIRIGRRVRIKRADFDALVEASYTGNRPAQSEAIWGGDVPVPDVPNAPDRDQAD